MCITRDRKNGKLTGRFRVEVTRQRKRLRGRANSMKEAKALERDFLERLGPRGYAPTTPRKATGLPVTATNSPLGLTLREGLCRSKDILWSRQATKEESRKKLNRIVAILGENLRLDDVDTNAADRLILALLANDCADSTINRYLSCLSAFLRFCKRRGYRTLDLPELEWRDEEETRIRWFTKDEETELLKTLREPYATVAYIAIRTGMRASELLTLRPEQLSPGWAHLWKTKSGSERYVPLAPGLYELLAPLVSAGAYPSNAPRLMPRYWQLRNEWERARRQMGLADDRTFVFHACRHTYATRAVQADVNIRVLQKLMGHKNIQTTLRYAHIENKTLADAVAKMHAFHDADRSPQVGNFGLLCS